MVCFHFSIIADSRKLLRLICILYTLHNKPLKKMGNMPSARILIVKDERQTVDTLRDMFEQHGYETEVALNKQVALTILQEQSMDIAIVSASVQEESSGGDILHEVRKLNATMPIIMISEQKSKRIESSSIKAGAKIFLLKPLDYVCLQTIENLLESDSPLLYKKKKRKTSKSKK